MTDAEKRRYKRLTTTQVTRLTASDEKADEIVVDTRITNLSVGGILLEVEEALAVGSVVELELRLPNLAEDVPVTAVVRHVEPLDSGGVAMGCEFLRVSVEHHQALASFVQAYD